MGGVSKGLKKALNPMSVIKSKNLLLNPAGYLINKQLPKQKAIKDDPEKEQMDASAAAAEAANQDIINRKKRNRASSLLGASGYWGIPGSSGSSGAGSGSGGSFLNMGKTTLGE
jgi:hypothetical protein